MMQPRFILVSHHPFDHDKGPTASVHASMIGPHRRFDLAGFVDANDGDHVEQALAAAVVEGESPTFLFNGMGSLLQPGSIPVLEHAMSAQLPVAVYWHETSWNLRALSAKRPFDFSLVRTLLAAVDVEHWVTTPAARHPISALFPVELEQIRVVYEVADLDTFSEAPLPPLSGERPVCLAGAGVPVARKGIDRFVELSDTLLQLGDHSTEFRWYAATPENLEAQEHRHSRVRWMGHAEEFASELAGIDALLLTSRDDPFPLVALQALAVGRPVFCYDTVGTAEVLPPQFVATDTEDLERLLRQWWDTRHEWTSSDFRAIAEQFSVDRFADRVTRALPTARAEVAAAPYADLAIDERTLLFESVTRLQREIRRGRAAVRAHQSVLDEVSDLRARRARDAAMLARARNRLRKMWSTAPNAARSVVVVGSSPSLLGQGLGPVIDQFDEVVRINSFATKGFEDDVGSKTTRAFISFACAPSEELSALPGDRIHLFLPDGRSLDEARERMAQPNGCHLDPSDVCVLDQTSFVDGLMSLVDPPVGSWPSTGLAAVQWASDVYRSQAVVAVCGFSFYAETLERGVQELRRYDGTVSPVDGRHAFDAERSRLERMLERDEIIVLEPDSAARVTAKLAEAASAATPSPTTMSLGRLVHGVRWRLRRVRRRFVRR